MNKALYFSHFSILKIILCFLKQVLPLLTLNQYFTTFICRDVQRAVDGRILKVRILTDLGLYSEAIIVLQVIFINEFFKSQNIRKKGHSS